MEVGRSNLAERYGSLSTDELIEMWARGGLTDLASELLWEELDRRGVPSEDLESAEAVAENGRQKAAEAEEKLATLGARLAAQVIDGFVAFAMLLLILVILDPASGHGSSLLALVPFLGYLWLADALPRGQSIGKRFLGISVVTADTNRSCSVIQSFIRNFPLTVLGFFDWVFIFGNARQRLGDKLARTIVIKTKHVGSLAENSTAA